MWVLLHGVSPSELPPVYHGMLYRVTRYRRIVSLSIQLAQLSAEYSPMAHPHLAPRPVYPPRAIAVDRLAQMQQQCNAYADRKAMAAREYADQKIAAHVLCYMRGGWLIAIGLLGACTVVNVVVTMAVLGLG